MTVKFEPESSLFLKRTDSCRHISYVIFFFFLNILVDICKSNRDAHLGITEWFELEATLKTTQFHPPCHKQGDTIIS